VSGSFFDVNQNVKGSYLITCQSDACTVQSWELFFGCARYWTWPCLACARQMLYHFEPGSQSFVLLVVFDRVFWVAGVHHHAQLQPQKFLRKPTPPRNAVSPLYNPLKSMSN
jgi:hypothetical protein